MKIPLIDSRGDLIATLEAEQFPLKMAVLTIAGVREYVVHLNHVRNDTTKKLDKTKVKSMNMSLNLAD